MTSATIRWKGSARYAPSTVVWSNGQVMPVSDLFAQSEWGFPSPGPMPPAGATVVSGSFSGQVVTAVLRSVPVPSSACGGANLVRNLSMFFPRSPGSNAALRVL